MDSVMTEQDGSVPTLWRTILAELSGNGDVSGQLIGFAHLAIPKGILGDTLYLEVGDELTRSKLEHNLRTQLLDAIAAVHSPGLTNYAVTVNPEITLPEAPPPAAEPSPRTALFAGSTATAAIPVTPRDPSSRLNAKYTFDTFVIGPSNRLAHAAAFAVAEAPAMAYNPLFIYGSSGLGKTHLLHAIGHYAMSLNPMTRVRYVSSEEFTNDFINSIQNREQAAFLSRYRDVDVLLVDDIQFLQRASETQEAFFHTFNTLHEHNKQVVITSDQPPRQLSGFEERMTSRFEWGLTTDVQAPDLATRIAILRQKAKNERLQIPDDVLEFIGTKISNNVRELEGTLLKVTAFASLNHQPIDLDLAQSALKDIIPLDDNSNIPPSEIIAATARYYGFSVEDVCGPSRSQQVVLARHIAIYLCRELTNLSLPKIAQIFGGRDHTTVLYANKKIGDLMMERMSIYNQVTEISGLIRHNHR